MGKNMYSKWASVLLLSIYFYCKRQPIESKPEIKSMYVNSTAGLWLRKTPNQTGEKIKLLTHSTGLLVADEKKFPDLIEGRQGNWRRVKYGAYEGHVFDGYLTSTFSEVIAKDRYMAGKVAEMYRDFDQAPTNQEKDKILDKIINYNHRDRDFNLADASYEGCVVALEKRHCGGALGSTDFYNYTDRKVFYEELKKNLATPTRRFFEEALNCLLLVGCIACDTGHTVPKPIFLPNLLKALRKAKKSKIYEVPNPLGDDKNPAVVVDPENFPDPDRKYMYFVVDNVLGSYKIRAVLGTYEERKETPALAMCYP